MVRYIMQKKPALFLRPNPSLVRCQQNEWNYTKDVKGPSQLTGTQRRLAERCSLAADIIYYALGPNSQAKLFPGELPIKEPDKENPDALGDTGQGSCVQQQSLQPLHTYGFEMQRLPPRAERQLCPKPLSSRPCMHPFAPPGQRGSLLRSSCTGPSAGTEFVLSARILPLR